MIYKAEIERALDGAPDVSWAAVGSRPIDGSDVIVGDLEQLRVLMREFDNFLGLPPDSQYIDETIHHEGEHEEAWKVVGVTGVKFGLRILNHDRSTGIVDTRPFMQIWVSGTPSELELAATAAYPTEPSDIDVAHVIESGFSGIDEVAERAIANNRAGQKTVPVPLSFKKQAERSISIIDGLRS